MNRFLILALPLIATSGAALAVDLQTVYDNALTADPVMKVCNSYSRSDESADRSLAASITASVMRRMRVAA